MIFALPFARNVLRNSRVDFCFFSIVGEAIDGREYFVRLPYISPLIQAIKKHDNHVVECAARFFLAVGDCEAPAEVPSIWTQGSCKPVSARVRVLKDRFRCLKGPLNLLVAVRARHNGKCLRGQVHPWPILSITVNPLSLVVVVPLQESADS